MQLKNIIRSSLNIDRLSIIYIGSTTQLIECLSNICDLYLTNKKDNYNLYDGKESYDLIIIDDIAFQNTFDKVRFAENIPCIFLATKLPPKKETGWMIKNNMSVERILAVSEELYRAYYSEGPIINLENKKETEECLKKIKT